MSATESRKPRFMASGDSDGAVPAMFKPLRDTPPPQVAFAKHLDPKAAAPVSAPVQNNVIKASAAAFAPLNGQKPAPPPAPVAPPVAAAPPPPPPKPAEPDYPAIARAVATLKLQGERLAAEARSDALEIGFQVARRILEMELTTNPEPLFALIRTALQKAGEAKQVRVRLNPDDLLRVESSGGPQQLQTFNIISVQLVPDATLTRGDCIVETEFGAVDGRLNSRLDELQRSLKAAMAGDAA